MNDDGFSGYLDRRNDDQVRWCDTKSARKSRIYYCVQPVGIVLAAVTAAPAGAGLARKGNIDWANWLPTVFSLLVAIGTALRGTFENQENWLDYRITAETLKKEKVLYDTETGDSVGLDVGIRKELVVERVEAAISRENALRLTSQLKKDRDKKLE